MTRKINDPYDERKRFEDINHKSFKKFQQALKQAEAKKESLFGKVYDKRTGQFVMPSEVSESCGKPIEKDFFVKNGSLFSRLEAEMELFVEHHTSSRLKKNKHASNLICRESQFRKDSDLIQPGTFASSSSSPMKMMPKKPSTACKSSKDCGPELTIVGGNGEPIRQDPKKRLINDFQFY